MIHRYGVPTEHLDDDVNHVPGVMPGNMMEELQGLAADRETIVEIGSYKGKSACALASTCPGIVYCIDPWTGHGFPVNEPDPLSVYREFLAYTAHHGFLGNNIVPLTMTSRKAAAYFAYESVDMVFIDGDHSPSAVMNDLFSWEYRLRDNGLVCGDDYGSPSVQKAVNAFASGFGWSVHLKHDNKMWFLTKGQEA